MTPTRISATRDCPICGSPDFTCIYRQSFEHMWQGGLLDGYDVVICNECGAGFANGIPPQSAFDTYYRDLSKYEYAYRDGKESPEDASRQEHLAKLLSEVILDKGSRILEVGCANGKLLGLLKERGYANVYGIDPSPGCAEAANRLYGVRVFTYSIFEMPAPEDPYDFVILLGVMEHVRDLRTAVAELREQTSDRGRVFIGVPDAAHLVMAHDAPFQEFSTEHINFFSARSLSNLMISNGFDEMSCKPVRLETEPGVFIPVVLGVFERSSISRPIMKDDETRRGLADYIREGQRLDSDLRFRIEAALAKNVPLLVWGVGTHTRRLLANGVLSKGNIAAFVDSSPKYVGKSLQGIRIIAPQEVKGRSEPILISSYAFQNEIEQQAREELRLTNEIVLLYDRAKSKMEAPAKVL